MRHTVALHTKETHMSTTPFEIRLELLKMSKDLLEHDYFAQKELAITDWQSRAGAAMTDRKSTRLNSSHSQQSRMPTSA